MRITSLLWRAYPLLSRLLPSFYYPYRVAGGRIYLDVTESEMMLARALGRFEVAKHDALRALLRPGQRFVDVGVNKGDFALLAARIVGETGEVLAFEPEPTNCHWIRRSLERNGYRNVRLHELALGNENGTAHLHLGRRSGSHTLLPGRRDRDRGAIEVPVRRLDDLLAEIGCDGPIDMMKIDVEGAELQVLEGATRVLSEHRDLILLLDVHPHLGVDPAQVCEFLAQRGFGMFHEEPPFSTPVTSPAGVGALVARRV